MCTESVALSSVISCKEGNQNNVWRINGWGPGENFPNLRYYFSNFINCHFTRIASMWSKSPYKPDYFGLHWTFFAINSYTWDKRHLVNLLFYFTIPFIVAKMCVVYSLLNCWEGGGSPRIGSVKQPGISWQTAMT